MGAIINFSICVTDIPKTQIKKGKNGKGYVDITASVNDETRYGNNVSFFMSQSKEDRENKAPRTYVGNGKVSWVGENGISVAEKEVKQDAQEAKPKAQEFDDDELPF